tara:strand:+ start:165 stop:317 length:153 start_codon:yes stop_codon:yes gene_type:complete
LQNIKKIDKIREELINSDDRFISDIVSKLPDQHLLKLVTMAAKVANQTKQ